MNRRGFIGGILAAGVAPFVVRAEMLMPVRKIWLPPSGVLGKYALQIAPGIYLDDYTHGVDRGNVVLSQDGKRFHSLAMQVGGH